MTIEQCISDCEQVMFGAQIMKQTEVYEYNRQLADWLKELKAYREILANADRIIESEYGCVIIEGYADVIDQMNEVFRENKQ